MNQGESSGRSGRGAGLEAYRDGERGVPIGSQNDTLGLIQRMEQRRSCLLGNAAGRAHPGADALTVRRGRVMRGMLQIMGDGRAHRAAHHEQYGEKEQTSRRLK